MHIEQIYTPCLSEAAYIIHSDGEAVVIDPLRDVDTYINKAKEANAEIKYVLETHFHADFVSGHVDLAKKANCPIVFGPGANTDYDIINATDGQIFEIGSVKIEVLHTPGHTLESVCYLLYDKTGKPHAVFTGDTLFVGDVGRPDLMGGTATKEELAGLLFDSLTNKIKTLEDNVLVYPAHGPGSACGKALGSETFSTIGEQKKSNYALADQTKSDFIQAVKEGLAQPPKYFPLNAKWNKEGLRSMDDILERSSKPLSLSEFKLMMNDGIMILDTRDSELFKERFIPGSLSIGLNGRFAEWCGKLLDFSKPVLLIAEKGKEEESIIRLARVGYENVVGFLDGGIESWAEEIDMVISIDPDEFKMDYHWDQYIRVFDVRNPGEYEAKHVDVAHNLPLPTLFERYSELDEEKDYYIHCRSGYRSVIACSILKMKGIHSVKNVNGGFLAIEQEDVQLISENQVSEVTS